MKDTNNSVLLIDQYQSSPLKLIESKDTPSGEHTNVVIATLYGTLSDFGHETRNKRWYTGSLWKKVLNSDLFLEALQTKTLFGEPDHPLDVENRLEVHIPYISHIIRDPKINESKQVVEGYLDILDTPYGRIIKTLIDYGCELGVSSRGSGDLTEDPRYGVVVDENTYQFVTWDIVARPSNKNARVHEIDTVNSTGKTAYESFKEQIETMIKNHDSTSLKLTESLISNSNISDKDDLLEMISVAGNDEADLKEDTTTSDELVKKSDLDDAYRRVNELKQKVIELDLKNRNLGEKEVQYLNTIDGLTESNDSLKLMISSYMDKLVESNNSSTTQNLETYTNSIEDDNTDDSFSYSFDELLNNIRDMIDKSNDELSDKLSKVVEKLDDTTKDDEISTTSKKLDDALSENISLKKKNKSLSEELSQVTRQYELVVNEYFKTRCLQLGINERLARKEFSGKLYEYDFNDINNTLTEMYSSTSRSTQSKLTNSSSSNKKSLGKIEVPHNNDTETDNDLEDYGLLTESIRAVRLS